MEWQPIETAPKGDRAVGPVEIGQKVLLLFPNGEVCVGYWDWYYAEGGRGYEGGTAWVEPATGELVDLKYGAPTHWSPIPPNPSDAGLKEGGSRLSRF